MKKIFNYLLVNCVVVLVLASCGNENDIQVERLNTEGNQERHERHIIYNGVDYFVQYEIIDDSLVYLGNKEFQELYTNEISKLPNLVTSVFEDGTIEYFNSVEEFARIKNITIPSEEQIKSEMNTKVYAPIGEVTFWDDTKFRDRSFTFQCLPRGSFGGDGSARVAQFKDKPYKFNDKCSSLKFRAFGGKIIVYMYEHDNYRGKCLFFYGGPTSQTLEIPSLKDYNFNDKMTSFILIQQ